ncbi:unnamed protein product [Kuraishia capsulata CBS 1993]|uniref:Protein BNI4 n=1 Tax=Kuraishia capsulata CBS 1993 TaxID=1382522 RepID=W6MMU5_9ASCO|nr:uncharacterized protein KUCA_T00003886001 [Kuraishia capsulata CBS 1993]CDK27906.1 unnamed protein product [Kuraishia capsulata CBS 1993]
MAPVVESSDFYFFQSARKFGEVDNSPAVADQVHSSTPSSITSQGDDDMFARLDQSSSVQTSLSTADHDPHDAINSLSKQFYAGPSFNHNGLNNRGHTNYVRNSIVVSPSFTSELTTSRLDNSQEVPTKTFGMTPSPSMQALESLVSDRRKTSPTYSLGTLTEEADPVPRTNQSQISLNTFYTAVSADTIIQQEKAPGSDNGLDNEINSNTGPEIFHEHDVRGEQNQKIEPQYLAVGPNPPTEDLISLSSNSPALKQLGNQMTPSLFSPGMVEAPVQGLEFLNPSSFGTVMNSRSTNYPGLSNPGFSNANTADDSGYISIISEDDDDEDNRNHAFEPRRGDDFNSLNSDNDEESLEESLHEQKKVITVPTGKPTAVQQTFSPVPDYTIRAVDNEDVVENVVENPSSSRYEKVLRPMDVNSPEPVVSLEKQLPLTPVVDVGRDITASPAIISQPAPPSRSNSSFSLNNWSSKTRKQKGMSMPVNKLDEEKENKHRKRRSLIGLFKREKPVMETSISKKDPKPAKTPTMPSPALSTGSQSSFGRRFKSKSVSNFDDMAAPPQKSKLLSGWKRKSVSNLPESKPVEQRPKATRRKSLLETYGFSGNTSSTSPAPSNVQPSPNLPVALSEKFIDAPAISPKIHEPAAAKPLIEKHHSDETVVNEQQAKLYVGGSEQKNETPQKQVLAPPFDPRKAGLGISFDAYRFDETPESEARPNANLNAARNLQPLQLSPKSPSRGNLHAGEALFPKSLDSEEVTSIVTMERSRSMRSVRSSPVDRMIANDLDSIVNADGMILIRSPHRLHADVSSRGSYSPNKRSPEPALHNDAGLMDYLDFISFGDVEVSTDFHLREDQSFRLNAVPSLKPVENVYVPPKTILTPEITKELDLSYVSPQANGAPNLEAYPSPSISDDLVSRNAQLLAALDTPDLDSGSPFSPIVDQSPALSSSSAKADVFVPAAPRPVSSSFRGLRGPAFGSGQAHPRDSLISASSAPDDLYDPFESRESVNSEELMEQGQQDSHGKSASVSSFVHSITSRRDKKVSVSTAKLPKQKPPKTLIRKRLSKSVDMMNSSVTVRFSSRIVLYNTYDPEDYDRHPEVATCNQLTPQLAQQIKDELNEFKAEMDIHEQSRCYTHFF